jgi:hypothetical protein
MNTPPSPAITSVLVTSVPMPPALKGVNIPRTGGAGGD